MNDSTIYILLGIISFLCSVASVLGMYVFVDGFEIRKKILNNPRTPLAMSAGCFVVYYLVFLSLGI